MIWFIILFQKQSFPKIHLYYLCILPRRIWIIDCNGVRLLIIKKSSETKKIPNVVDMNSVSEDKSRWCVMHLPYTTHHKIDERFAVGRTKNHGGKTSNRSRAKEFFQVTIFVATNSINAKGCERRTIIETVPYTTCSLVWREQWIADLNVLENETDSRRLEDTIRGIAYQGHYYWWFDSWYFPWYRL